MNTGPQTTADELQGRASRNGSARPAFTLIELVVVIAVIATLAALLLPTLARVRAGTAKTECAANLRQLGAAITLFANDNNQTFPPGADDSDEGGDPMMSWDVYINFYITGVHLSPQQLKMYEDNNSIPNYHAPGVLVCPADTGPDTYWVATVGQGIIARRTYAMNAAGIQNGAGQTMGPSAKGGAYKLPPVEQGVGVWWTGDANDPSNAPGYKTPVVVQPAATILLAEEANGHNVAENDWSAICLGPYSTDSGVGVGDLCQMDPNDSSNEGATLYQSHGNQFNYLFHDNHVAPYAVQDTVGPGSTNINGTWSVPATNGFPATNGIGPKGLWTITDPNGNY
jgi:prepilin-type N-terminal cleavage/methylation domain-containing protein/prepilin-type processing-associated H-X9-DG protein